MANLSRWKRRIPKWEGNADDPAPFALEFKRMSVDERAAMRIALAEVKAGGVTIGDVLALAVRGPIGDLSFDDEPFKGGIKELVDGLATRDPLAYHTLTTEIFATIAEVNGFSAGE